MTKRRWRKVLPNRSGWVDRDVVPHDAAAVMLTIKCEMTRPLSQNWVTRTSDNLFRGAIDGDDQSVGSTGSQTTNARTGLPPNSRIRSWVAEAPCRHTIQVGDGSSKMRISLLAALNSFLISPTFSAVRLRRGAGRAEPGSRHKSRLAPQGESPQAADGVLPPHGITVPANAPPRWPSFAGRRSTGIRIRLRATKLQS